LLGRTGRARGRRRFPFTYYLFNRGPLAPLRCRRGPFPGTYMIRYADYAGYAG
jgi:hypothetical protein